MKEMLYEALEEAPSPESKYRLFIILSWLFIIIMLIVFEGRSLLSALQIYNRFMDGWKCEITNNVLLI